MKLKQHSNLYNRKLMNEMLN